jgi:hypothetical protein
MTEHVNGSGAVDLGGLRATDQQKQQLAMELLSKAGLVCGCGERVREDSVTYFTLVEGPVDGPQGPMLGLSLVVHTVCGRSCDHAAVLEEAALCRRESSGRVVWLDERREKAAAARETD